MLVRSTSPLLVAPLDRGGGLDVMRFVAATGIVVYHYASNAPVVLEQTNPLFVRGYLATDFFLILSGFVLACVYGGRLTRGLISPFTFLGRRLLRIWPAHLIVLSAMAVVAIIGPLAHLHPQHPDHFLWRDFIAQALLVQAWGPIGGEGWNLPTWSLSALLPCYAAMPLLWMAVGRVRSALVALGLAIGSVWMGNNLCELIWRHAIYDMPAWGGVARALPLFTCGICLAQFNRLAPRRSLSSPHLALASLFGLIALQFTGRHDAVSLALIGLMIVTLGDVRVVKPIIGAAEGARLSFSLFVTHALTATVWFGLAHKVQTALDLHMALDWAIWGIGLVAALATAVVFERWIDRPSQAWLNGILGRQSHAPSVEVATS